MGHDGKADRTSGTPPVASAGGSGKRTKLDVVLVVDDLEDNRELLTYAFERVGFLVACARDGAEAIEEAERLRPSAIVMDLAMPVLDGWQATRAIRATPALEHVPIVILSAFGDALSKQRAIEAGCDVYLQKPHPPGELALRVRELLDSRLKRAAGEHE